MRNRYVESPLSSTEDDSGKTGKVFPISVPHPSACSHLTMLLSWHQTQLPVLYLSRKGSVPWRYRIGYKFVRWELGALQQQEPDVFWRNEYTVKPSYKRCAINQVRNQSLAELDMGPWSFSFPLECAISHGQSAADELYGCFLVLNVLRSSLETPSEAASRCTTLRHNGTSRTNRSLSLKLRALQAHPRLETRSFSSEQLGFLAAGSRSCMDTSTSNAAVGIGLVLLKLLS